MTVETPRPVIAAIQCLRGVAAFMVVLHHLQNQTVRLGLPHVPAEALRAGVDMFFVISGFIMWVTTAARPDRTPAEFWRDRIARIVPLYWAVTAFVVAVALAAPSVLSTTAFHGPHVAASFLFLPAAHPVTGAFQPVLIPGWTLNLEMFFYLLFGAAMIVPVRRRAGVMIGTLALLAAVGAVARPGGATGFLTQGVLIEFAAGIVIGMAYLSGRTPRSRRWWAVSAAGFTGLAFLPALPVDRALLWSLPSAAIVAGAALGPPLGWRPLERLGDWSYALYLSHPITLAAALKGWTMLPAAIPAPLFAPAALGGAVLAAALLFRFVELPATGAARAWLRPVGRAGGWTPRLRQRSLR